MKKQLFMTSAMAATLLAASGCSSNDGWNDDTYTERDTAVCVDREGTRVDDDHCDDDRGGGSNAFLWYYIGRNSAIPYYGDSISDRRFAGRGTYRQQPGIIYDRAPVSTNMTRSQAVSRGGLGSSSRRFGGGRS
jgi:hypothetical protein